MVSEYFKTLSGNSALPVISLIVFLSAFIILFIWIIKLDKNLLSRMGNIPLDLKTENQNNLENKDEVN